MARPFQDSQSLEERASCQTASNAAAPKGQRRRPWKARLRKNPSRSASRCWQLSRPPYLEAIGIRADLNHLAFKGTPAGRRPLSGRSGQRNPGLPSKAYPELNRQQVRSSWLRPYRTGGEFHLNSPEMARPCMHAVAAGPGLRQSSPLTAHLLEHTAGQRPALLLETEAGAPHLPLDQVEILKKHLHAVSATVGNELGALFRREAH